MRKTSALLVLAKARWLEIALLIGFSGMLLWVVMVTSPVVPSVVRILLPSRTERAGPFDGQAAFEHVLVQMAIGPRPTGSEGGRRTGDYIVQQLREHGWEVEEQVFTYRDVLGRNIIARAGEGEVAIIGAHYDTRRVADHDSEPARRGDPVPGANDGASGVAVLLELARSLDKDKLSNEVWLTFFDAEDNGGLDGWDYLAGSTVMAERLTVRPEMVVIADMIGDRDQQIYQERNSSPELVGRIWSIAERLGYGDVFLPTAKWSIIDDHMPFLAQGIPAVDLIDFDYPYYHTTLDTVERVAPESLERVGRVLQALLEDQ